MRDEVGQAVQHSEVREALTPCFGRAQLGKKPHAHSDFVGQYGPMVLHRMDADVDVMVRIAALLLKLHGLGIAYRAAYRVCSHIS